MTHETPTYIGFEEYSEHVPAGIPSAVQQATQRFLSGRAARVAELPQWEELRQIGSNIRLHVIENLDFYLEAFAEKVEKYLAVPKDAVVKRRLLRDLEEVLRELLLRHLDA